MLLNTDAKMLEWVCAVYLSQDAVGMDEIIKGFDIHDDNQKRFKLPERIIAKTLLFRTIYGGTGYSFATDPEFGAIGGEGWWDETATKFYEKYKGLHAWHERLVQRVVESNGRLEVPTGRIYQFQPYKNQRGEVKWPRTKILNYPVQGLAADLMSIVRVSLYKRLKQDFEAYDTGLLFVNTVHDSVVLDISSKVWDNSSKDIVSTVQEVFEDVPLNFHKLFRVEFNLPLRADISYGMDWKSMKEIQ